MNIIEKVARALYEREHPNMQKGWAWGKARTSEGIRTYWMDSARAAIEAMREPTEAMLDHMATTNNCYDSGNYAAVWAFGIDSALSEPEGTKQDASS